MKINWNLLIKKRMMLLHNENRDILNQKVMMDDVFGMLMIEGVIWMVQFVNYMEGESGNGKRMNWR